MSRSSDFFDKYGPWAMVTGASDGIGRAFAVALAALGLNLVLVARRRARLIDLATELSVKYGVEVLPLELDLARYDSVATLATSTETIDVGILIAAAGFGTSGPFLGLTIEQELELIDVNCRAVLALVHLFGRRMAIRRRGGLVMMSSLLAFQGVPRSANYAASKAYIQTLAEGLNLEFAPLGIDVIACAPGPIRSGFEARANMRMNLGQKPDIVATSTLRALGRRSTVRPGWLSKTLEASLALLPRRGRTRMMARVMAGMTKHQLEDLRPLNHPAS
jgi:uncharacterized protein